MKALLVVLLAVFCLSCNVFAQDYGGSSSSMKSSSSGDQMQSATINSFDSTGNVLSFTDSSGKSMSEPLSDNVKIMGSDGSTKATSDLKSGKKANITQNKEGDTMKISKIELM